MCVCLCVSILLLPKSGMIITARKRSLGQGNMFTGVCLSTGGVPGPGGCLVLGGARWRPPRTATAAGGTQPTGMHSCFTFEITFHWFR